MDDHCGHGKFKILINSLGPRIEPKPKPERMQSATHVVVQDEPGLEHKIRTKNTVICAGAIESPSILLRSMGEDLTKQTFGKEFAHGFGHVTDHQIFYVTLPFYYNDMKLRDTLSGVKLQTDITFQYLDNTTALAQRRRRGRHPRRGPQDKHGWDNVYVCDLSVFPYSPAANTTLSLAALSLRLSDHLVPPKETRYQPISVHNLCLNSIFVTMTLSNTASSMSSDPPSSTANKQVELKSCQSMTWKREQTETIFIYTFETSRDFDVQIVQPGVAAFITN